MTTNNHTPIYRVAIIEPSPIIQIGLREVIGKSTNFEVVGILTDINRIEAQLAVLRADIVIINPTVIEFHRRTNIKALIPDTILVALLYSYVDNDIMRQFSGIIEAYDDTTKIHNTLQAATTQTNDLETSDANEDLSEREREILVAVAKGMMNKEIATLYNLSIHTVISHRKNISRKTGIKSVSGFVVYALFNNLLEQSEIHL